jgi:phosphatidylserine decarboxylase
MIDRAVGIPIVREGMPFVAGLGGATALAAVLGWAAPATVLGVLTCFTAWFFRNPARAISRVPGAVVSPADGTIIVIQREYEPRFLKEPATRISIFLNIFDVHVNRMPCEGIIDDVVYQPGRFLPANRAEAMLSNEQNALMIRATDGVKILCVQVAGLIARRIVCWVSPGEAVRRGERFGLIRFGSRVDLYVPEDTALKVAVGHHVKGGRDVLGILPDRRSSCAEP